ncbi:hypothetical protein GCM10010341_81720 [Streptomyces noursei]|nr:hypothetical protein GCM10010341_81720 [Streptomyces noursei]
MTSVGLTVGGVVAEPVRMRRLTDQEGQKLQQIVRRGSTSSVRIRRAMMLLASAGGNRVPVIAKLVQADEDTVRDVIHRFTEIGLACLDPRWAGGRPRPLSPGDADFVVQTATTRPTKLGQPFTRWSIRKLAAYLRKVHDRAGHVGARGRHRPGGNRRPRQPAHPRPRQDQNAPRGAAQHDPATGTPAHALPRSATTTYPGIMQPGPTQATCPTPAGNSSAPPSKPGVRPATASASPPTTCAP